MKRMVIPMMVLVVLTSLTSVVMAGHNDHNGDAKAGRLFLFQKCDETLKGQTVDGVTYDSTVGCPTPSQGPWPIFFGNRRYGQMDYTLWGPRFRFSFEGKRVLPENNYTLIYYPDPWPGEGLICLGTGKSNKAGNINIWGSRDIGTSLPAPVLNITNKPKTPDANFNPISPSGAVGAKIWLVRSEDVDCGNGTSRMLNWDPEAYLFEYNLIVYEHIEMGPDEGDED